MVEKVIKCIAAAIWEKFDGGLNVYTEKISQGLKMPCAFAECEKVERVPLLGDRYFLRIYALVTVETRSETGRNDSEKMLGDIFSAMNMVRLDDVFVRGRRLKAERYDTALRIRGVYDVYICEKEDKDLMEIMDSKRE